MTLRVPFRFQRTTGAAVLFSVAMHALVLISLTQCIMRPQADLSLDNESRRPPIEVMILTEPMLALSTLVTRDVPDSTAPSSAERVRQQVAVTTVPQSKQSVPSRDVRIETRSVEDVAHDVRLGGNPSDMPTTASRLIASAGEQSRSDGHATPTIAMSAEGQPDERPSQSARPDYCANVLAG